jgi:hypothetical protein
MNVNVNGLAAAAAFSLKRVMWKEGPAEGWKDLWLMDFEGRGVQSTIFLNFIHIP